MEKCCPEVDVGMCSMQKLQSVLLILLNQSCQIKSNISRFRKPSRSFWCFIAIGTIDFTASVNFRPKYAIPSFAHIFLLLLASIKRNDNKIFIFEVLKILLAFIHKKVERVKMSRLSGRKKIQYTTCRFASLLFFHKYLIQHYGSAEWKAERKRRGSERRITVFAEWMKSSLFKTEHCRELHVAMKGGEAGEWRQLISVVALKGKKSLRIDFKQIWQASCWNFKWRLDDQSESIAL